MHHYAFTDTMPGTPYGLVCPQICAIGRGEGDIIGVPLYGLGLQPVTPFCRAFARGVSEGNTDVCFYGVMFG